MDVLEIDGASNRGVEEIRNLRDSVRYAPVRGKYKVYIVDEVHMLTKEAFNALLKTLEEPPERTKFIFATTEPFKLPPTIQSRCQRFDFRRISVDDITSNLRTIAKEENITIDDESLRLIAGKGDGSLRDAQSIFDQVASFCGNKITLDQVLSSLNIVDTEYFFRVTDLMKTKNTKGGLELVEEIMGRGFDIQEFLAGLLDHLRNLLVTVTLGSARLIEASEQNRKRYEEVSTSHTEGDLVRLIKLVADAENTLKYSPHPRLKLETTLMQMIRMESTVQIETLLQRLEELGGRMGKGGQTKSNPPASSGPEWKSNPPALKDQSTKSSLISEPTLDYRVSLVQEVHDQSASKEPDTKSIAPEDKTRNQPKPSSALSLDDVRARWDEFVSEVRRQKISVGTMLSQCRLVGIEGNKLKLGCPDDYWLTSVKRNRDFISEVLQRTYNTKLIVDGGLYAANEIEESAAPQPGTQTKSLNQSPPPTSSHPVIQAMMKELGAESID
jgi:DNA polymerase-3 subunit gamma/tau